MNNFFYIKDLKWYKDNYAIRYDFAKQFQKIKFEEILTNENFIQGKYKNFSCWFLKNEIIFENQLKAKLIFDIIYKGDIYDFPKTSLS